MSDVRSDMRSKVRTRAHHGKLSKLDTAQPKLLLRSMNMLTTDQKGNIAETSITAAAVKLGVVVYRPVPTRNNQLEKINWAKDYEFAATLRPHGAIAQLGERRRGTPKVAGSSPAGSTFSDIAQTTPDRRIR